MKTPCCLLPLVLASAGARTTWDQITDAYDFAAYAAEFGKSYGEAAERAARADIFAGRLAVIRAHNADASHGWKRGVNALTDRTPAELRAMKGLDKAMLHGGKAAAAAKAALARGAPAAPAAPASAADLPPSVDWRDHGAVTPVKNQGECGSCWTFASAETLESHWYLQTGKLQELSEQFILDCTPNPAQCGGQGGCAGGTAELAYARLKSTGGLPSEWTYPYTSGKGDLAGWLLLTTRVFDINH